MNATKIQEPGLLGKILCSASKFSQVRDLSQVLFGRHRTEATIPDVYAQKEKRAKNYLPPVASYSERSKEGFIFVFLSSQFSI